jgi:hypothetical protein
VQSIIPETATARACSNRASGAFLSRPVWERRRAACAKRDAGYLTLWLTDTLGTRQLYPNDARRADTEAKDANSNVVPLRRVTGGERLCIGEGEGFRILIKKPLGVTHFEYVWTAADQINAHRALEDAERAIIVTPGDSDLGGLHCHQHAHN